MQTVSTARSARRLARASSGTLHGVFDYIQDADGVPYDTCQNYEATDSEVCWAPTYCKACKGPVGECFGVPAKPSWDPEGHGFWFNGVPKVEVQEWGYIGTLLNNTVRDLQIEIVTRGPIACMVDPRPLNSYKEGIIDAAWTRPSGTRTWSRSSAGARRTATSSGTSAIRGATTGESAASGASRAQRELGRTVRSAFRACARGPCRTSGGRSTTPSARILTARRIARRGTRATRAGRSPPT